MDNLNIITPSTSKSPPVSSKTSMMMLDRSVTSKPTITLMSPKTSPTINNHVTEVTVENHCLQDRPDPPQSSAEQNHDHHNSFLWHFSSQQIISASFLLQQLEVTSSPEKQGAAAGSSGWKPEPSLGPWR